MTTNAWYGRLALVFLFMLALYPLSPYIVPLFMGVILCVVGWRAQRRLEVRLHLPRALAAAIHALVWLAVIAVPTWLIIQTVVANLGPLVHKWQAGAALITVPPTVARTPLVGPWLATHLRTLNAPVLLQYLRHHSDMIRASLAHIWIFLLHTLIASLVVFSLALRGEKIHSELDKLTQSLWGSGGPQMLVLAAQSARAVMVGLIGVGLVEGVLIGASYGIAGMPLWTVWMVATILLSAVPFGASMVLAVVAGWLMLTGHFLAGLLVVIWGTAVITAADLLLRPLVTGLQSGVPFLVLLLSILGGAKVFGLVGIIAGPFLVMLGSAIWQSWFREPTLV
ncbi:MAG: AI-2E family transporter [Acidiferrobacter sp.]